MMTTEAGLAHWLTTRGHKVLAVEKLEKTLSEALNAATTRPLDRSRVLSSLPDSNRRLDTDFWMHAIK